MAKDKNNHTIKEEEHMPSMADVLLDNETVDADALLADFDRESNTRIYSGNVSKWIVRIGLIAIIGFIFYCLFATVEERARKSLFLGLIIFTGYLMYPAYKKQPTALKQIPWQDVLLAVLGSAPYFYFAFNSRAFIEKATKITTADILIAFVGIILLFELCRRVVGIPIMCVAGAFIVYMIYNCVAERGYDIAKTFEKIAYQLFYSNVSIMGTPINVCVSFIVLFILFGSFLEKSGIGNFFIDLANSVAGGYAGGPAKVAVISSALEGMYSGSSVANTVGSGSVTIPVMKKAGYKPEFAAAVEAAASTGGQIMPPIMGAAAFLMAEITGETYLRIAVAAILPAILYFTGIFVMVHFEAKKLGLRGMPKESIPNFFHLFLRKGYLLLPIVILVGLMSAGRTSSFSVCIAIVAAIVISSFSKATRFTPAKFVEAIENGAKNAIGVSVACAMAGIVSGIITFTDLAGTLIRTIVPIAQTNVFIALFLTMLVCIVCGMGVPTTANYILMATITAPILTEMGIPVLAAHMFVFFFGIVADITPPVALAAYAGSAIAHSNPLKTGVQATKLAITAFIIPYVFALSPEILWIDTSFADVVRIVITSIVGMLALSGGLECYMFLPLKVWERLILIAGGVLLVIPSVITDVVGLLAVVLGVVLQLIRMKVGDKTTANT